MTRLAKTTRATSLNNYMYSIGMDRDAYIAGMYEAVFGDTLDDHVAMQQRLGPIITRANRFLASYGRVIKPGDLKRTYRLTTV